MLPEFLIPEFLLGLVEEPLLGELLRMLDDLLFEGLELEPDGFVLELEGRACVPEGLV